jgi:hypothetical protein
MKEAKTRMQQDNQSKLLKLALKNKQIAIAILGQAILDEGGIGAYGITIFYTNENEKAPLDDSKFSGICESL